VSPSPFAFPGVGGAQSIYIFSAIVAKASRNGWTGIVFEFHSPIHSKMSNTRSTAITVMLLIVCA
jgi:hypothetical protein